MTIFGPVSDSQSDKSQNSDQNAAKRLAQANQEVLAERKAASSMAPKTNSENGSLDFGNHNALYGGSDSVVPSHPFSPSAVAQAGAIDATVLNNHLAGNNPTPNSGVGAEKTSAGSDQAGAQASSNTSKSLYLASQSIGFQWLEGDSGAASANDQASLRALGAAAGVDQGAKVGDCGFESSLAGLARTKNGPQAISNMIQENSNGSYTVTFPGDKKNPVNVTQSDMDKAGVSNSAAWANVIETAAIKHEGVSSINGIDGTKAIGLLTGQHANTDNIYTGLDGSNSTRLGQHMIDSLNNGGIVLAGTKGKTGGGVETDHWYTVTNYDPKTQTVTLRNPWGENAETNLAGTGQTKDGVTGTAAGEVTMSMATFKNKFDTLEYTGKPPSTMQQAGRIVSNVTHSLIDLL